MTWHHFTLSSLFPPLESIFQAFYSNLPLLSHSFPIVLRHIPSFVHCLSQISDIWHEDCIAYKIWAKTELLHITCVSSPHIETAIFPLLFHYAIMVPHRSLNFTWHHLTFPYSFHRFSSRINFPSVLLKFSIAFPFFPLFYIIVSHFFHCFSHHFPLLSHFFPIVLCHIPSFFHCFSQHFPSFSPPFPFFSHCFTSKGGPGFLSVRLLHSGHTSKRPFFHCFSNVSRVLYVTWHHFTLSSVFPPLQSIFQAFYSNLPLLSHSFPIVLRHIPSFVHCLFHNPYSCTA